MRPHHEQAAKAVQEVRCPAQREAAKSTDAEIDADEHREVPPMSTDYGSSP